MIYVAPSIYFVCVKNVQITIDERMLAELERVGKSLGLKRSQIVRQALREWLHRHAVERFEQDWIRSLEEKPDQAGRADAWIGIQAWNEKRTEASDSFVQLDNIHTVPKTRAFRFAPPLEM